jgi:hypothetical protein
VPERNEHDFGIGPLDGRLAGEPEPVFQKPLGFTAWAENLGPGKHLDHTFMTTACPPARRRNNDRKLVGVVE